jgi:hypothetical protein
VTRSQALTNNSCECLDLVACGLFPALEHRHLQRRAIHPELVHERSGHWLHNPMDVHRSPARVRPEIDIDLVGLNELGEHTGDLLQEWTELVRLGSRELPHVKYVPSRLHDERSDSEWADAVFDEPVIRLVDQTSWEMQPSLGKVARQTTVHPGQPSPPAASTIRSVERKESHRRP